MVSPESLRSRSKMAANSSPNGATPLSDPDTPLKAARARTSKSVSMPRSSPFLPTRSESLLLAVYPALLTFGTLFSLVSPQTRGVEYSYDTRSMTQDPLLVPSYFARKDNLFNVLFVKRGWAWLSAVVWLFVATHPASGSQQRRVKSMIRWALVTGWWVLVTQWAFGPALIDKGFRLSGGRCEIAHFEVEAGTAGSKDVFTAAACKSLGGKWSGGHDISGHVFLLVLGSYMLVQEVGWPLLRWARGNAHEERSVIMGDGAVKGAGVEAEDAGRAGVDALEGFSGWGIAGKVAAVIITLSYWMLLMTAIYFHTWFEKLTGLSTALIAIYGVYFLPRWVPTWRQLIGLPGI